MKKVWTDGLIFTVISVSVPLFILAIIKLTPEPPVDKMEYARKTISVAWNSGAETYSKKLYTDAVAYYDSAMVNWKKENIRFIYFRNFEKVEIFAELSAEKAIVASENSLHNSSDLKLKLIQKIKSLNDLISEIDELFNTYPLTSEVRNRISKGKLLLKEAEIAFRNEHFLLANIKISDSEYLLDGSYKSINENLKIYFESYSIWKNWVDNTIKESKRNRDYSIIIDKFSRKCYVYFKGIKKYEFYAELGRNWVGNKRVSGDKATPEGMYKITKKIEGKKTLYHKALLLNYPNEEDLENFKSDVKNGLIPATSKIGGLIEIHGSGGKGTDWTNGCVALTDKEIDIIFRVAKIGTPVTIVGSMVNLQYVFKKVN